MQFQPFSYTLPDLGVKLNVNINLNELIKFRGMLLKSEFIEKYIFLDGIYHISY